MSLKVSSTENGGSGILFIGFNQNAEFFTVGLQNGFRIYYTDPLKQIEHKDFTSREGSGIGHVEMHYRDNILLMLGGGSSPKIMPNECQLWDDYKGKFTMRFGCPGHIKSIKFHNQRIVLVLNSVLKIYSFEKLPQMLYQYETRDNPNGLCAMGQDEKRALLAYPGKKDGSVVWANLCALEKAPQLVMAHTSPIAALALNEMGTRLATASEKGTLIRIFNTENEELLYELRRGANQAVIYSIAFNLQNTMVGVSSDNGTVHIFRLEGEKKSPKTTGAQALLPQYFSSHVSDVRCCVPGKIKTICAFSNQAENKIIVLAANGYYWKYRFNDKGETVRETFVRFLDTDDDSDS